MPKKQLERFWALTIFEMKRKYQNEPKYNGVYSVNK